MATATAYGQAAQTQDVGGLWNRYRKTREVGLRNQLVLSYTGLVRSIAKRIVSISGNYTELEDLMSYGMIGLIKAVEKFDPEKGAAFETFATYRVRGEIIDYMRRNDWVPRGVRRKSWEIENVSNQLLGELGRQPNDDELAERLGIGKKELRQMLSEVERFNLVSFEEIIQDTVRVDREFADFETPEGFLQEDEMLEVLAKSLDALPEREKLVLTLYYYEELTLREISQVIGVSESRVSQLHSRAVERMRKSLKAYVNS
jgi:RNA polymerase sigma factor for flagellar operon FliA